MAARDGPIACCPGTALRRAGVRPFQLRTRVAGSIVGVLMSSVFLLMVPTLAFGEGLGVPELDALHMPELVEWVYRNGAATDPEPCGEVCRNLWESEQHTSVNGGAWAPFGEMMLGTGLWGTLAELAAELRGESLLPGG